MRFQSLILILLAACSLCPAVLADDFRIEIKNQVKALKLKKDERVYRGKRIFIFNGLNENGMVDLIDEETETHEISLFPMCLGRTTQDNVVIGKGAVKIGAPLRIGEEVYQGERLYTVVGISGGGNAVLREKSTKKIEESIHPETLGRLDAKKVPKEVRDYLNPPLEVEEAVEVLGESAKIVALGGDGRATLKLLKDGSLETVLYPNTLKLRPKPPTPPLGTAGVTAKEAVEPEAPHSAPAARLPQTED